MKKQQALAMTGIAAMMLSACSAHELADNTSAAQKDIPQSTQQETQPDLGQSSSDNAQSSADRPQSFATSAQVEPTPARSSETPQQHSNLSVENTHPATTGITTHPSTPNSTHGNQPTFHDFQAQYLKAKEAYDKALARYNAATSTTKIEERSALELTLAKALNDLADAQTALNTAQEKQASHKAAIDAATQKVESETEKVEAAKSDRQQAIDNAMKVLDAKNAEIAQYQETKANAERHLASLGTEKTNLEAQLIRDKEAVKAAEDELNKAQAALRQAQEANADLMAAAQQRLSQAQTALDNAQNTQAEAQQRLNELKGELATAKARLLDAQSEYDAKVSEISTHAADLKKLVNQRDEAVKTAQATLESAQNERYAAEGDLEIAQGFLTSAEAELARLKETSTDELEGNFESATRTLEEAKKKVADATSALEEATRTYDAEQAKYERMLEELNNVVDFSALTSSQKMLVVSDMVAAIINQHRLDAGLNALAVNDYHNAKARERSQILADTKFATEKKEGSQYAGTNEGHTHDANMAANDATGLENVGYVLAKGDLDVTWAEPDGGQHVEHLDLDKDPMYVAWVIAQQWRQSPEQYHTMLDADSSAMSVGLVYDEKTNRVYMTMRVYQGSADQPNHYKSEGLYKPFDHSDLYGFKLKKMDFTGHDENGLNQSGQNTYKNHAGSDVRDWSADIEYRHAQGITDTRPTLDDVNRQKGIADQAAEDKATKETLKSEAESELNTANEAKAKAEAAYTQHMDAVKLAQLKFDNATKTKEAAERAFGTASTEATQAEEALNTAKAELTKAQEELKAIPGVDDIDTGAIEKARVDVAAKEAAVHEQEIHAAEADTAVGVAENEKALAGAELDKANKATEAETAALKSAEATLTEARSAQSTTEKSIENAAKASGEAEATLVESNQKLDTAKSELPALKEAAQNAESLIVDTSALEKAKAQLDSEKQQYDAAAAEVTSAQESINAAQTQADAAKTKREHIDAETAAAAEELSVAKENLQRAANQAGGYPLQ